MKYFRVSEAAEKLKVSASTVRRYSNEGRLTYTRNPSGQRVYTQSDLDVFLGKQPSLETIAFYVRASDGDNKRLKTQEELLTASYGMPDQVFRDRASGLNENRPGLKSLLESVRKGKFTHVAVTEKDRLTRFGFSYLEALLNHSGVTLIVLGEKEQKSLEEELLQDFMSLIASFSGKFYRMRGHAQQRALLDKAKEALDEKHK